MDLIELAREIAGERHPDAHAAFLGGSVLTGRRTATSDLDIVVLLPGPPAPYRESFQHAGWPVELFVHTEESWHGFVERETARRRSPLLRMCAEGVLLADTDGLGRRLAVEAGSRLAAGPPPTTVAELEDRRYALTDLLDDLAGGPGAGERLFVVSAIAELALLRRNAWLGGGKWLARQLDEHVPGLSEHLADAVQQALGGRPAELVRAAEQVLDEAGGRLWGGYHRGG